MRGSRALISVQSSIADPLTRVYAEETYLVLMVGLLCWLGGRRVAIDRTELAVARPAQEDDLLLWGRTCAWAAGVPRWSSTVPACAGRWSRTWRR